MSQRTLESLQVTGVVTFYMTSALVMIFVNKAVLNSSPILPFIFLFLQMFIAVILLHLSAFVWKKVILPSKSDITWEKTKQLAPVVLVNIIGLVFNTLCLRDVDASFFQIARGLVLPLTIVLSSLSTRTRPTLMVVGCAIIVTMGFLIGVYPVFATSRYNAFTSSSRVTSVIYGLLSSFFIALHAVLIKSSLPYVDGSALKLAWWTNVGSALALVPCIIATGELWLIKGLLDYGIDLQGMVGGVHTWNWRMFVWGSAVTGFFGFLLCIAGLLSIKVTSPITHMFSSAAKGVLQVLLGVWIFEDLFTTTRAASTIVILAGTMYASDLFLEFRCSSFRAIQSIHLG
ncbi:hypothetical protein BU17DRAFT_39194 [Hysterangium stoloniferum]|nr:hypothetical protein BU17DRAFT_39194 [Hysterangium stoloniferum]